MGSERVNDSPYFSFKMFHTNTGENNDISNLFFFDVLGFSIEKVIIFLDEILEVGETISFGSSENHSLKSNVIDGVN